MAKHFSARVVTMALKQFQPLQRTLSKQLHRLLIIFPIILSILRTGKGGGAGGGAGKSKSMGGAKVRPGFEGKTNAGFLNKSGGGKGGGGGKKK